MLLSSVPSQIIRHNYFDSRFNYGIFVAATALVADGAHRRQMESLLRAGATPRKVVRRCQEG
jgi:hypothetical protein